MCKCSKAQSLNCTGVRRFRTSWTAAGGRKKGGRGRWAGRTLSETVCHVCQQNMHLVCAPLQQAKTKALTMLCKRQDGRQLAHAINHANLQQPVQASDPIHPQGLSEAPETPKTHHLAALCNTSPYRTCLATPRSTAVCQQGIQRAKDRGARGV